MDRVGRVAGWEVEDRFPAVGDEPTVARHSAVVHSLGSAPAACSLRIGGAGRTAARLALPALVLAACGRGPADGPITASGTIEATQVHVAARVPGLLTAVLPREGERVDSGAVLATTDHGELDWQLAQARAALDVVRAHLTLAENGPQAEDVDQAEAAQEQARVQSEAAAVDLRRVRQLAAAGTATPKQEDDARTRVEATAAALRMAQAQAAKLRAGTRAEQLEAARAQVAQAQAQVGAMERRLADTAIRAPMAGVITERLMEPGEMANPGSAVLTLSDLDHLWLKVYLSEVEVGRIRLGQAVAVALDAAPDAPRSGRVSYVSPTAEFTPKNVQTRNERVKLVFGVKVAVDNAGGRLKPGLPADAVFVEAEGTSHAGGD